jgi:hypothetical protein
MHHQSTRESTGNKNDFCAVDEKLSQQYRPRLLDNKQTIKDAGDSTTHSKSITHSIHSRGSVSE